MGYYISQDREGIFLNNDVTGHIVAKIYADHHYIMEALKSYQEHLESIDEMLCTLAHNEELIEAAKGLKNDSNEAS